MNCSAIDFLTAAINSGKLEDTSESYLQKNILGASDSWYNRMVRDEGEDAAKQTYQNWQFRKECTPFGTVVRPIVESMIEIALNDRKGELTFIFSPNNEDGISPFGFGSNEYKTAVVLENPEKQGFGRTIPKGFHIWNRRGSLKLLAVALLQTLPSERSAVCLVFEPYNLPPEAIAGYTCLEFGPGGHVMSYSRYSLPEENSNFFMRQVCAFRRSVLRKIYVVIFCVYKNYDTDFDKITDISPLP